MDLTYLHASSLLDNILQCSTQFDNSQLEEMQNAFLIRKSKATEKNLDLDGVNKLLYGIKNQMSVKIEYHSFAGNRKLERIINPYFFVLQESKLHLIAFCNLRNDIRDFRVSRMCNITELNRPFDKNESAIEDYESRRFVHLSGGETNKIKLLFSKKIARFIQEYEKEKADEIVSTKQGEIVFIKYAGITDEIVRWILSFGGDVIVLEPKELRFRIKESVNHMFENYCDE